MARLLTLLVWTCLPLSSWGEVPAEVLTIQQTMHRIIDRAEPSVASIAVSRSDQYREFRGSISTDLSGKLGSFFSRTWLADPNLPDERKQLLRRLDLSTPDSIPDSFGTGIVIDPAGLILTTWHVVRDATRVYIRMPSGQGSYADIHAADMRADLAVLRLQNPIRGLKPLEFGAAEKARKGDLIVALANSFNSGFRDGSPSATWGILSNLRRRPPGSTREEDRTNNKPLSHYGTMFQLDSTLNPGSSGGVVLDLEGRAIAILSATAGQVGGDRAGGFAFPLDRNMRRIIEVLKRGEEVEYGFLGISLMSQDFATNPGVTIGVVAPGSAAERAGLYPSDTIVAIDDRPVRDQDDLFLHIGAALCGNEVRIRTQSVRGIGNVTATLSRSGSSGNSIASRRPAPVFGLRVESTSTLTQKTLPIGVAVREIEPNSPAAKKVAPRKANARIVVEKVNGKVVRTPIEFYAEAAIDPETVELTVIDADDTTAASRRTIRLP